MIFKFYEKNTLIHHIKTSRNQSERYKSIKIYKYINIHMKYSLASLSYIGLRYIRCMNADS